MSLPVSFLQFFVRSSKVAKSLLPELHTRHVSDATSFDGYKPSVQNAPQNSAFTPSSSPSFLSYSVGRNSPAGSQKSDDGSSSTNSRSMVFQNSVASRILKLYFNIFWENFHRYFWFLGKKSNSLLSAAVKNAIVSNINATKNIMAAGKTPIHQSPSSSALSVPPVYPSVPSVSPFDAVQNYPRYVN